MKRICNSMEKSPSWEADTHSASQEISRLLWNPKVHYRVRKIPSPVRIMSQMNPVHTFPPYFRKIHPNIILPSTPRSSEWSLPPKSFNQNIVGIYCISHACYMPHPFHPPWLDLNTMGWSVQVMKLLIVQSSPASCLFLPLSSAPVLKYPQSMFFPLCKRPNFTPL
jgi:hypothetical protein